MTQEEKQLLLKDLSARLPYGVMIKSVGENKIIGLWDLKDVDNLPLPYLRSMSSMTEEEKKEVKKLSVCDDGAFHNDIYDVGISMEEAFNAISWFLERHFDINYLIQKGLALEAPENMYKTE